MSASARLRRSLLFVPGNHVRRIEKALTLDADAVVLDLEDACPLAEKVVARDSVAEALRRPRACAAYVRINSLTTVFAYDDLRAVVQEGLDGILLPKVESAAQLHTADWLLTQLERERHLAPGSIELLPLVETATGIAALAELACASRRVRCFAFGAADLALDLGMRTSLDESELFFFRSQLVLQSRVARLEPPIDCAWLSLNLADEFVRSVQRARTLGFQGKLCIHPDHAVTINDAFTPSEEQVMHARRVVAMFEEAEARGSAAILVDGLFVDYPVAEQARRILATANLIAQHPAKPMC